MEADVNFSKIDGISNELIMDEVHIKPNIRSDEPWKKIEHAEELTLQECPVVFTFNNPFESISFLVVPNG